MVDENRTEEGEHIAKGIELRTLKCPCHGEPLDVCGEWLGRQQYLGEWPDSSEPPCEGAVPCQCDCHKDATGNVRHIMACCNNGWILPYERY